MEELRAYLNSLTPAQQEAFAESCGTTIGYLRKAISVEAKLGEGLVIALEKNSRGVVRCEKLRPDVDWKYLLNRRFPSRGPRIRSMVSVS